MFMRIYSNPQGRQPGLKAYFTPRQKSCGRDVPIKVKDECWSHQMGAVRYCACRLCGFKPLRDRYQRMMLMLATKSRWHYPLCIVHMVLHRVCVDTKPSRVLGKGHGKLKVLSGASHSAIGLRAGGESSAA